MEGRSRGQDRLAREHDLAGTKVDVLHAGGGRRLDVAFVEPGLRLERRCGLDGRFRGQDLVPRP